jgi:predicted nucleic acid-binding protein
VVLVDTSIRINHLRSGNDPLANLLDEQEVLGHPFVIGEIALGDLSNMSSLLKDLASLPAAAVASDDEVLRFIADQSLAGQGIGLIDVHLLAATFLTLGSKLWTFDKKLFAVAARMMIALDP